MARGWGRSEEDLEAEKEQARAERALSSKRLPFPEAERLAERRKLDLSLARVNEELAKTSHANRRKALESAREEIIERSRRLDHEI